ncbi:MAG: hypothetical protein RIQ60_1926 [Pseudomonadota bacterium]|jgi:PAS domain S-box-containing protein
MNNTDSNYRLKLILDNLFSYVALLDIDGRVQEVNKAPLLRAGYRYEDIIGQYFHDAPWWSYDADVKKQLMDAIEAARNGISSRYDVFVKMGDSLTPIDFQISPVVDQSGKIIGLLPTAVDITARLAVEQELRQHRTKLEEQVKSRTADLLVSKEAAEAANIAKSVFLANMSHEIRTPLNAITGMAHMIRQEGLTPNQMDQMRKLEAASHHLSEVINNILDLSKIEAGKLSLNKQELRLDLLTDDVRSILFERIQETALEFNIELPEDLPLLLGDATRLRQGLLNYASNALKFTEKGRITLRVQILEESEDNAKVLFEVEDTGVGISPDAMPRLFTAFEQADNSTTRKYGGTGLGLIITRKIAQLSGGDAGARSTLGQGSTFWFTARLDKVQTSAPSHDFAGQGELDAINTLKRDHADRRILLVEDDVLNREVSGYLLEDAGLSYDIAVDGLDAVSKSGQADYHVILMDMQMPRMNGLEATMAIRVSARNSNAHIIAMTANAFNDDKVRCLDAGMNDFIAKPVEPEKFYQILLKWMTASR